MQFFGKTNIDFVSKRNTWVIFSVSIIAIGLIFAFIFPPKFGIDFTGGSEVAVAFSENINTNDIRSAISEAGIKNAEIKSFGEANQYLIRVSELGDVQVTIQNALEKIPNNKVTILKVDKIGAKIGGEMRLQAYLAVFLSIIAMLIYIGFRFEFVFGLGAIVALVHDVFFVISIILIFNGLGIMDLEINQSIVAAILTVVGYSINDTVIIFDRVRENRVSHKGIHLMKLFNLSVNETLSRTINTVLTVVITLVVLLTFGGPVLQGFSFTMLVGILVGTYSSIFIASNFVIFYNEKIKKIDLESGWAAEKAKAAKV
ncbi:MAG: protein-export membrane protein SecF [Ignavibacteria bacterium GWF2_33_9]|nr:MAG: protein-export membrane protein SecF [Ignavibacteria bacterium GWF2_33_9]